MLVTYRGLLAGFLAAGVAAVCAGPGDLAAQDKKDKNADLGDRTIAVATSDGLTLKGYWFQGNALEKQLPDAVMMFPAPGGKIDDAWIDLARALSEKNFSVLLFDWRGCGLNGPQGQGIRVFDDPDKFWNEAYNAQMLKARRGQFEKTGLDWKLLSGASDGRGGRYRDFLFNDLLAARFYLDKQSDAGKCNTNRVWVVSEKDGAHMGMAFAAAEFQRNTQYKPQGNVFDTATQFKPAGKDYAGVIALSYSANGPSYASANMVYRNALPSVGADARVKEAMTHLEDRLALVLLFSKKEGPGASKALAASLRVSGDDAFMRKKFKYLKEIDTGKGAKQITGIDMIDPSDSFGAKAAVVEAAVGISKAQGWGKDPTDRNAGKILYPPRFAIEMFNKK